MWKSSVPHEVHERRIQIVVVVVVLILWTGTDAPAFGAYGGPQEPSETSR